jgi:hypothetical protein
MFNKQRDITHKVTQVQQISSVRQKFGYFGMMAAILIVTAALCWGLAHI